MNELIALLTFATGIPLVVIGYIMSIIAVREMKLSWKFGMILGFPFALPFLALIHWQQAKKPFIYACTGCLLILFTLLNVPNQ